MYCIYAVLGFSDVFFKAESIGGTSETLAFEYIKKSKLHYLVELFELLNYFKFACMNYGHFKVYSFSSFFPFKMSTSF